VKSIRMRGKAQEKTKSGQRGARVGATAAAVAVGCAPLAWPPIAAADVIDKHLAVDCPQPYSQMCPPRQGVTFNTDDGKSYFWFTADPNPPACAPGDVNLYFDGAQVGPQWQVQPGKDTGPQRMDNSPGSHTVEVQVTGVQAGCNTGSMSGWSGTLHVRTGADIPAPQMTGKPTTTAPPPPNGHTVTGDVDLYEKPGGQGKKIGTLKQGDAVTLNGPCPIQAQGATNGWCQVTDTTQNLTGAVWGDFISK
jgi:hypothetical protein